MRRQLTLSVSCAVLLATALSAHGGQYRGPPGIPVVPLPVLNGPPAAPPTPGPTTGARDVQPYTISWQTWWEFNKEPYLLPRSATSVVPITGSDDFYLGPNRPNLVADVLAPTEDDRKSRIVPALIALLEADRNRDVQSATLVALGKVGQDPPGGELEAVLAERLKRDDQEVRETAVLSLAIAGRAAAFPMLVSLVQDDKKARAMVDRSEVRDRTRAFAAYGLGLLARRLGDPKLSQQAYEVLWGVLKDEQENDRDLLTGALSGLGVLRGDPERSADKRLAWILVEQLLDWFAADRGAGDEQIQAHAGPAIGRLLGRDVSSLHQRCKQAFVDELDDKNRRGAAIRQSAAIALGMLALPEERDAADAFCSAALRSCYERGRDQTTRWFAVIALGRIGGEANRDWLLKAYNKASRATAAPWLAIALGLLAQPAAAAGSPDAVVGQLLLSDLIDAQTDDQRSALAVALGLAGHTDAAPTVMQQLSAHEGDERAAGYLCVGLGLLHDAVAVPQLSAVLRRSGRRPFLLQQCAVALGCLGDKNANEQLVAMLKEYDSTAVLAAIATAIGRIGDRRAIDPLIELTADKRMTKLARAFAAAALGGVGDKDALPWNTSLSIDSNWATFVDTLSNGSTGVLDIL
ncbi:MAG: HEAT repeat domain-containing protein [Planctomycetes bacterium]|nr:HEAT repeat domain-containing protein [Planctomycetota bacterium]